MSTFEFTLFKCFILNNMSVLKRLEFENTEPKGHQRKGGRGQSKKKSFRKPKYRPHPIPKPSFQKLFKKTNKINSYVSFEEWLARLTGSDAYIIRKEAVKIKKMHQFGSKLSIAQVALLTTLILASWPSLGSSEDIGDSIIAEMRASGEIESVQPDQPSRTIINTPVAVVPSSNFNSKKTHSQTRQERRDLKKERLRLKLLQLYKIREARLPAEGLDLWTESKWMSYLTDTLADDEKYFQREMQVTTEWLAQVYDLVDDPLDGAGDGQMKRNIMAPVLRPVIYDLALHALRTDWTFVNASFHRKIYDDLGSIQKQRERASSIVRTLAVQADLPFEHSEVTSNIIQYVNRNPEEWYDAKVEPLGGKNMVKFLRKTTKDYVRSALKRIPSDNQLEIEKSLHTAAIIDASLSGKSIQQRTNDRSGVGNIERSLHGSNPLAKQIVEHYRFFLKERLTSSAIRKNAINALIVRSMDNEENLVRDVQRLWTIYDEQSVNAFRQQERSAYDSIAEQFLENILRPFKERDQRNRGRQEGMDYLNDIFHTWANKILIGIFMAIGLGSRIGCKRCRMRFCSVCKKSKKKATVADNKKIRNMKVYRFGSSSLLWIKEKNGYRRISTRGHPDFYTVIKTTRGNRQDGIYAGWINENSIFEPLE